MKKIAIEEHYLTKEYIRYIYERKEEPRRRSIDDLTSRLLVDIDERLKEMDRFGIEMQLLSQSTPSVDEFDAATGIHWAKNINDDMARITREHPGRFGGLATLPLQDVAAAVAELERAVKLGLQGTMIKSHVNGEFLDDRRFRPVFAKAQELDVPIYLHPKRPAPSMIKPYLDYPGFNSAMIGYGADLHLHVMRLICSGLFDEYPRLKLVIGHMGETFPYLLWRIDNHFGRFEQYKKLKKKPSEYFRDNFYITTSGVCWQPSLLCAYLTLGADKIMFAVDYPMESNEEAVRFIETAPICDEDKEKICHLNAEKLFRL